MGLTARPGPLPGEAGEARAPPKAVKVEEGLRSSWEARDPGSGSGSGSYSGSGSATGNLEEWVAYVEQWKNEIVE